MGFLGFVIDFFRGRDLDGGRRTDARWSKHGTNLIDGDQFTTHAWHYWPQRRRAGVRVAYVSAVVYLPVAAWLDPAAAVDSARIAAWTTLALLVWRVVHRTRRAQWREERIVPTFLAIAPQLDIDRHVDPLSILRVPRDYLTNPDRPVAISLPRDFSGTKVARERLVATASSRLGMVNPDPDFVIENTQEPKLLLRAAPAPPSIVSGEALETLLGEREPGQLVLGVGPRKKIVSADLDQENPHLALSVTTGGGKSATATSVAMQVLHDGGIVLVLDPKVVSLQWAKFLPNVRYADSTAAIHDALVWLRDEIDKRYEVIGQLADINGNVDPEVVGPRILVVAEELNSLMPALQRYWQSIREKEDPKPSPAVDGFRRGLAMGRQGRVHMMPIAQYLTAAVTGGGDGRENLSTRILIAPSFRAWMMLGGPEYKIGSKFPPTLPGAGRGYVLHKGVAQPVQLGYASPKFAQDYASSGEIVPFRSTMATMPRLGSVSDRVAGNELVPQPCDQGEDPATVTGHEDARILTLAPSEYVEQAPEEALVTLSEACERGILSITCGAAKMRRARDVGFPAPAEQTGQTFRYRPVDLRCYEMDRAREASAR